MTIIAAADERTFWLEVFDGTGARLGAGPLDNVRNARIIRSLDSVGQIAFSVPGTDQRAADLLSIGNRVDLYIYERESKRLLGSGIVRKKRTTATSGGFDLTITGPDILDDLRRKSVLLALEYNDETLDDIVNGTGGLTGLLDFVTGWSATVTASGNQYARFDGMTVLKALQELVESKGIHFRLGDTAQTIEVGAFGDSNGLVLVQTEAYTPDMDSNDTIGLIQNIMISEDGDDVVNFIVALAAGEGETRLTLADSTRTTPYTIQTDTFNGQPYDYIGTSTKTIAQILADNSLTMKVLVFDQIQIQSNSDADILTAANALYDIAAAWLDRHSTTHTEYSIEAVKLRSNIKPGDKMRLTYKGWIQDADGNTLPPQNINAEFWIMSVTEQINFDGVSTLLKLASIDRIQRDTAHIIVGELERARVRELSVKSYTSHHTYVWDREIDNSHDATVPVRITDRTLRVRSVILYVKSDKFRSTAAGAASGGGSTQTSTSQSPTPVIFRLDSSPPGGSSTLRKFTIFNGASTGFFEANTSFAPPQTFEPTTVPGHDHDVTLPAHSHAQTYGITDDTVFPAGITITINGVDRTSALGGPWGSSGSAVDLELDITQYITDEATLRKEHPILFGCASNQGRIEVTAEIYEDIQNLKAP